MPKRPRSSKRCHLLAIPREVRHNIYEHLIVSADVIRPEVQTLFDIAATYERDLTFPSHEIVLALARTCRVLHDEVIAVYFGSNSFSFPNTYDLYRYLYMIGEERRRCIKKIEICFHGPHPRDAFELLGECIHLQKLYIGVNKWTTKFARRPQKDLWYARGVGALRRIRGLPSLDLRVREVLEWGLSSTDLFEEGINKSEWKWLHYFDADHIEDFERRLKEEMGGKKIETKDKETDDRVGSDENGGSKILNPSKSK